MEFRRHRLRRVGHRREDALPVKRLEVRSNGMVQESTRSRGVANSGRTDERHLDEAPEFDRAAIRERDGHGIGSSRRRAHPLSPAITARPRGPLAARGRPPPAARGQHRARSLTHPGRVCNRAKSADCVSGSRAARRPAYMGAHSRLRLDRRLAGTRRSQAARRRPRAATELHGKRSSVNRSARER